MLMFKSFITRFIVLEKLADSCLDFRDIDSSFSITAPFVLACFIKIVIKVEM